MNRSFRLKFLLVVSALIVLTACGGNRAPVPTNSSAPSSPTLPAPHQPASTTAAIPSNAAARANSENNLPAWWPHELAMPNGTTLENNVQGIAIWDNTDTDRTSIRDFLVNEAKAAGYRVVFTKDDIGSTVYFFKQLNAYTLTILKDSLTGTQNGFLHAQASGGASAEFDLPIPAQTQPVSDRILSLKAFLRNVPCGDCTESVLVIVDPFMGAGSFTSGNDMRVALEVIPGTNEAQADYKGGACTVVVQDEHMGTFDCKGMTNVYDDNKKIDVVGEWQLLNALGPAAGVTDAPDTPEPPTNEQTPSPDTANHVRIHYTLNLDGAQNVSGTIDQIDRLSSDCSIFNQRVALPVELKLGDKTILFGTGISSILGRSGQIPLDSTSQVSIMIGNVGLAGETFIFGDGSNGNETLNTDGSGAITIRDYVEQSDSTKHESGTIQWTCRN